MKKLLSVLTLALAATFAASADNVVQIYLNSGNVVTGTLLTPANAPKVVITAQNGQTYTYSQSEIRKIEVGENTVPKLATNNASKSGEGVSSSPYTASSGFWGAVESVTGYSCRFNKPNIGFEEIDVVAGYRFNEFFRVGIGAGARYYWNSNKLRYGKIDWSMPIFLNARGGFMNHAYRTCVPFYSVDAGGAIRDGLMVRPAIGLKIGDMRRAFTIALSYTAQGIKGYKTVLDPATKAPLCVSDNQVVSFISLKLGYEF